MTITDDQLCELHLLELDATPGPWVVNMDADIEAPDRLVFEDDPSDALPYRVAGFPYSAEGSQQRKDAAFICALRKYAKPLMAAAKNLNAELPAAWREDLQSLDASLERVALERDTAKKALAEALKELVRLGAISEQELTREERSQYHSEAYFNALDSFYDEAVRVKQLPHAAAVVYATKMAAPYDLRES